MSGTVYLDNDTKIVFSDPVPCDLVINCASPSNGMVVATGVLPDSDTRDDYTLTNADAYRLDYPGETYGIVLDNATNQLKLTTDVKFLNGAATGNGTGTQADPFKTLTAALNGTNEGGTIFVTGTTNVSSGTYSKDVLLKRASDFNGVMLQVSSGSNVATLSTMTLQGRGSGTAVNVSAGTLKIVDGVVIATIKKMPTSGLLPSV
jgi:hypothetical protein